MQGGWEAPLISLYWGIHMPLWRQGTFSNVICVGCSRVIMMFQQPRSHDIASMFGWANFRRKGQPKTIASTCVWDWLKRPTLPRKTIVRRHTGQKLVGLLLLLETTGEKSKCRPRSGSQHNSYMRGPEGPGGPEDQEDQRTRRTRGPGGPESLIIFFPGWLIFFPV